MYRPGTTPKGATTASSTAAQLTPALLNGVALPFAIEMVIDESSEAFTGLVAGDWPGHSPSILGVGRDGKLAIASFAEVTVTDSRVLPNELGYAIRAKRQQRTERAGKAGKATT
jgi:hypothetical protein